MALQLRTLGWCADPFVCQSISLPSSVSSDLNSCALVGSIQAGDKPKVGAAVISVNVAKSWSEAKRIARNVVYSDSEFTFYCGCAFQSKGRSGGDIDTSSCQYISLLAGYKNRAGRLEWEHVVPASLMPAAGLSCWVKGDPECERAGRECCERVDVDAQAQIFDLHNLVPSVGQVNALRSNKLYGEIDGEERKLGACDFEWSNSHVEPREGVRGDVARIWLYYNSHYGLELSDDELRMFNRWSSEDPPDEWEVIRNQRIKEIQGTGNPHIEVLLN